MPMLSNPFLDPAEIESARLELPEAAGGGPGGLADVLEGPVPLVEEEEVGPDEEDDSLSRVGRGL